MVFLLCAHSKDSFIFIRCCDLKTYFLDWNESCNYLVIIPFIFWIQPSIIIMVYRINTILIGFYGSIDVKWFEALLLYSMHIIWSLPNNELNFCWSLYYVTIILKYILLFVPHDHQSCLMPIYFSFSIAVGDIDP